jgi:hypothetical protein
MTRTASRGWSGDSLSEKPSTQGVAYPLADPLDRLKEALASAPVQTLPAFIGELERLKAQAWTRLAGPPLNDSDRARVMHDSSAKPLVDQDAEPEYLSIRDMARRINYAEGTIRNLMSRGVFKLGEHYMKPRGRILFKWSVVCRWVENQEAEN